MAFSRALRTSFGNTNRVCPSEHDLLTDQRSTLPPIWLTASSPLLWVFFRPKQCGGKHQLSPWHLHASHWRQIAISPAAMHQILGALASPFWTPFHQCGGHLSSLVTCGLTHKEGYGPHLPHHRAVHLLRHAGRCPDVHPVRPTVCRLITRLFATSRRNKTTALGP